MSYITVKMRSASHRILSLPTPTRLFHTQSKKKTESIVNFNKTVTGERKKTSGEKKIIWTRRNLV